MTPRTGIERGPHWWEASALTTAPSLDREEFTRSGITKMIVGFSSQNVHPGNSITSPD